MKKNGLFAGILMLCLAIWAMVGCADGPSDTAQNGALLLGLNNTMTEEKAAFVIMTALPAAQGAMQSSGGKSSSISSTKEMIAEINKNVSSAFLKSELGAQGTRESVSIIVDDTCENGTCYTLSGTGICSNGGSVTFNDLKMSLVMESVGNNMNMTGVMDGSATYAQCGGNSQNWLTYPEFLYSVIDGTIAQHDETDYVSIVIAGDVLSGSYTATNITKGTKTVTSESVIVNGTAFSQVALECNTDLMRTTQINNQTHSSNGNIFIYSGDYVDTITGSVTVAGTLGPENDVTAERIFNTETFRYHSECVMDTENFGVSCSVSMM